LAALASVFLHRDSELGFDNGPCAVFVLYENHAARERAIHLCGSLISGFEHDLEFEFTWWGFKYLSDPQVASEAALAATSADLILVSVESHLPLEVKAWFEDWPSKRQSSAGALVLLPAAAELENRTSAQASFLYSLAQRANLDYLPLFSTGSAAGATDKLREDRMFPDFPGLNHVPIHQQHSSGWGINE
jgi:hypothetical protein